MSAPGAKPEGVPRGTFGIEPPTAEEALFVDVADIIKARSPEAWQLIHVGTIKELIRVVFAKALATVEAKPKPKRVTAASGFKKGPK